MVSSEDDVDGLHVEIEVVVEINFIRDIDYIYETYITPNV
jgi:hypothetical protein